MRRRSSRRFSRHRWFSWPCWSPQPRCLRRYPKRSGVKALHAAWQSWSGLIWS